MNEENISQECRLKDLDEPKNYPIKETNQNDLMSEKRRNICTVLNYNEQSSILFSKFCFCFIDFHSYQCCKFCSQVTNMCNNCRN